MTAEARVGDAASALARAAKGDETELFRAIYRRLSPCVRASLTVAQVEGLRIAAAELNRGRHGLDLRLALPSPFGRFYLALFAGRDRRRSARPPRV
ncbi:MAG: hypothetical protein KDG89_18565 [Geminicoccaceae bacterium]|nr:hypothetical protein [Geminicoccaceae bacterium]